MYKNCISWFVKYTLDIVARARTRKSRSKFPPWIEWLLTFLALTLALVIERLIDKKFP